VIAEALLFVISANKAFTALAIGAVFVVVLLALAVLPELPLRTRKQRVLPPDSSYGSDGALRKLEENVGHEWLANYVTDEATRRRVDAAIADARSTAGYKPASSGEKT
jgi:hypothetical protein